MAGSIAEAFAKAVVEKGAAVAANTSDDIAKAAKKVITGSMQDYKEIYRAFGANGNATIKNELRPLIKQAIEENPKASIDEIINTVKANPKYIAPPTASPVAQLKGYDGRLRGPGLDEAAAKKTAELNKLSESIQNQSGGLFPLQENFSTQSDVVNKFNKYVETNKTDQTLAIMSGADTGPTEMAVRYQATQDEKILNGLIQDGTSSWNVAATETENLVRTNSGQLVATTRPAHIRLNENNGNEFGNVFSFKGEKFSFLPNNDSTPDAKSIKAGFDGILKDIDKMNAMSENTPWGSTAKAALGTAVVGAGICAALSSSRGQQNNAQLYGQQPLY